MFALRKCTSNLCRKGNISLMRKQLKHEMPELPYSFDALEPYICAEIMELHYSKHHAAYVKNLNAAEEKLKEAVENQDMNAMMSLLPSIKFNGGGHVNHTILWSTLAPPACTGTPSDELKCAIMASFGSQDKMQEKLSEMATSVQGSGWAWLGFCPKSKSLRLASCSNQDPLQSTAGLLPLFGIDVWEHAYYLQYKNDRAEYVTQIWEIVNWKAVSERFACAKNA